MNVTQMDLSSGVFFPGKGEYFKKEQNCFCGIMLSNYAYWHAIWIMVCEQCQFQIQGHTTLSNWFDWPTFAQWYVEYFFLKNMFLKGEQPVTFAQQVVLLYSGSRHKKYTVTLLFRRIVEF